ncbi:hypothetical protein J509_1857 [Acinetobacter baumannii 647609]|nr:hypothetical protein J509_1857 [Acinetobacter baumannii 647609]
MATGTVKLHRVFKAPAERVYRAFLDPDALVKWMAPHGFTAKVHSFDGLCCTNLSLKAYSTI